MTMPDAPAAVTDEWPIGGPNMLGSAPQNKHAVLRLLKIAQDRGEIVADRDPPEDDCTVIWIGKADDPIAFALFYEVQRQRVWLDVLYVAPHCRRLGFGRRLMTEVAEVCARAGMRRLMYGTTFDNNSMRILGRRTGFHEESLVAGRDLQVSA